MSAAQRAAMLQGCPRLCSPRQGQDGALQKEGTLPTGVATPSAMPTQQSRTETGTEPELCNPLSNHTSKGEQLPDRLQHISVVSVSIMKSVSTASRADRAGLDGTHTQYFVHKIHAYTLEKRLQIKKKNQTGLSLTQMILQIRWLSQC